MNNVYHISTKRAFVISAAAMAAIAVSALGVKAMNMHGAAQWQKRAQSYKDGTYKTPSSAYSDLTHISAKAQSPVSLDEGLLRDHALTQSLAPVKYVHHKAADFVKSEQICLAQTVYYEARSERRSGQMAVAEVVLNRVKSKHYPNSVCGVIYQGSGRKTGCQFSFACDGSMDRAPKGTHWEKAQEIATFMQTHNAKPLTHGATHYHTTAISPKWSANLRFDRKIGTHKFYRFKFTERPVVNAPSSLAIAPPI